MKLLFASLGAVTMVGVAAPVYADPGVEVSSVIDNANFLTALNAAGITYTDPNQVVEAARTMCGLLARGESGLAALQDLKGNNPGFSTDGAARFAALAAGSYCPQQLVSAGNGTVK